MSGTITTTTDAEALEYPGSSLMDCKPPAGGGSSFTVTLTGTTLDLWRQPASVGGWVHQTGMALVRANIIELGGFFIDAYSFGHLVYRVYESGKDRVFYRRINIISDPNVWGSEYLVCEAVAASAGAVYMGTDVIANGTRVAIAACYAQSPVTGIELHALKIATATAFPSTITTVTYTSFGGSRKWSWTGSGYMKPALDFQHNGTAHTSTTPHLWVTLGRTRSVFAKLPWGSGKWTGPSALSTFAASGTVVASNYNAARWDGTRYLATAVLSASPDVVTVYERDSANTKTIIRATPGHPQANIRARAINYESTTKDIRVYGVGTTTAQLYFVDYNRAAGTWGSWAQLSATALQDVDSWGLRRGTAGASRFDVYWQPASASPYTLAHVEQALSFAPATPRITAPLTGQPSDVGDPLYIEWTFSDPDPADTQSAYALSKQEGVATIEYWNASSGLWQGSEAQNASTVSNVTLAVGWGVDGDATHNYKVKVWDNTSTPSGYSTVASVVPATWTAVTITTPAAGAVLTSDLLSPAWTVAGADQTAVRLKLYKAFDQFGRTTANGWGTSDNGAVYTVTGGTTADFLTGNDGAGLFVGTITSATVNVERFAIADGTSAASDVTMDTRCPVTPTVADIVQSLVMFWINSTNYWRADVTFKVGGNVQLSIVKVVAGTPTTVVGPITALVTHVVTNSYSVRMAYAAGRIMAKLWVANEPNYWMVFVTAAEPELQGSIGARNIRNTGNTNGSQLHRYDNIRRNTIDLVYDSGQMNTTDLDYDIPYSLGDLTEWTLEVIVQNVERNIGRWPARHFIVDYVEPPTPTLTVSTQPAIGALRITATNPAPGGGQPAFQSNDVLRKINGQGDEQAIRLATQLVINAVWDDTTAVSGIDYQYRIRSFGVNGTHMDSAWT